MVFTTTGGLKVANAWTQAGYQSCVRVTGHGKGEDILFDIGSVNHECFSSKYCFITHGHLDHIGAAVPFARAKSLSFPPSVYYTSPGLVAPLTAVKEAYEQMSGEVIEMDIRSISPGDPPVKISERLFVFAFPTRHRISSQGYGVIVKYPGKLKSEYAHLDGDQIKQLRLDGVAIRDVTKEVCEVVYTGDTVFSALLEPALNFIFNAEVLIMECTYMDGLREKALKYSHVHIYDIVSHSHMFRNKMVLLVHISRKYTVDFVLQCLRSTLPDTLKAVTYVNLKLQGKREYLTCVTNTDFEKRLREEPGWGWGGARVKYSGGGQRAKKGTKSFGPK